MAVMPRLYCGATARPHWLFARARERVILIHITGYHS
jgi:hypothetical protein